MLYCIIVFGISTPRDSKPMNAQNNDLLPISGKKSANRLSIDGKWRLIPTYSALAAVRQQRNVFCTNQNQGQADS
jgi:hypothetical protein